MAHAGEVLWRLCRPVVGLAILAAVSLTLAMVLMGQASGLGQLMLTVASLLAGLALLAAVMAGAEFLFALLAWNKWLRGEGKRCPHCDWPWSPSILLPDRCISGRHADHPDADTD
ncbi:MAG: hypothetical protein JJT90_00235 [Ectothiorhodospiraceae bacterium]|nr:hypothetical protein [Ectothiorhodospiraceae bacterium]